MGVNSLNGSKFSLKMEVNSFGMGVISLRDGVIFPSEMELYPFGMELTRLRFVDDADAYPVPDFFFAVVVVSDQCFYYVAILQFVF